MASPVPVQKTHAFFGLFRGKPRGFHLCCLRRSEMKTSFHFTHYPRQIKNNQSAVTSPGMAMDDEGLYAAASLHMVLTTSATASAFFMPAPVFLANISRMACGTPSFNPPAIYPGATA